MQAVSPMALTPQVSTQAASVGQNSGYPAKIFFGTTEEPGGKDQAATKKNFFNTLREFISQNGMVQGTRQFMGVLADVFPWNQAFEDANPQSTYAERLQSLLYLAFAQFCEGFQSKNANTAKVVDRKIVHELYASVLKTYPKLLLANPETMPLDLAAQVAKTAAEPDATEAALKGVQARYRDVEEISVDDLRQDLEAALST